MINQDVDIGNGIFSNMRLTSYGAGFLIHIAIFLIFLTMLIILILSNLNIKKNTLIHSSFKKLRRSVVPSKGFGKVINFLIVGSIVLSSSILYDCMIWTKSFCGY
jgi:hypothetical protein